MSRWTLLSVKYNLESGDANFTSEEHVTMCLCTLVLGHCKQDLPI